MAKKISPRNAVGQPTIDPRTALGALQSCAQRGRELAARGPLDGATYTRWDTETKEWVEQSYGVNSSKAVQFSETGLNEFAFGLYAPEQEIALGRQRAIAAKVTLLEAWTSVLNQLVGPEPVAAATLSADVTAEQRGRMLNGEARRLLTFLYDWYVRASGQSFSIGPGPETFTATGLGIDTYDRAARRLVDKGLADWLGGSGSITITPSGVSAAEDPDLLDYELPNIPPKVNQIMNKSGGSSGGDPKLVFLIHGRDEIANTQMTLFLRALHLTVKSFDQVSAEAGSSAYLGQIIRRGMDEARCAIALFTADEWSTLAEERRSPHDKAHEVEHWVARQNVLFEAGMAIGIDETRTVLVTIGSVQLPSDIDGRHVVRMNNAPDRRDFLRAKLIGAGCDIPSTVTGFHNPSVAGNFDLCATPPKIADPAASTEAAPHALSDEDATLMLEGWLHILSDNVAGKGLLFTNIDREAGVPAGCSARLLPTLVEPPWSIIDYSPRVIRLKYVAVPDRVVDVAAKKNLFGSDGDF